MSVQICRKNINYIDITLTIVMNTCFIIGVSLPDVVIVVVTEFIPHL